ncbi:MAG: extensin family protein, partial [Hyphomicrobiaceae bacterium]
MSALAAVGLCLLAGASARAQGLAPAAEPGGSRSVDAGWSEQDIQLAQARCTVLLKGLDVVAVPDGPVREGSECGAPAPMRLISVGKGPQVAFSPPPTLTCDMIAALHKWVQRDVQPLARRLLAAPIVRIETMSSYSCRNAYGRAHGRLSEHGRANAVDIGSFVTALGHAALVVSDWGLTAREVAAAAAAAARAQPPP